MVAIDVQMSVVGEATGEIKREAGLNPEDLLGLTIAVLKGERGEIDALDGNKRFAAIWRTIQGYDLHQAADDLRLPDADRFMTLVGLLGIIWRQTKVEEDARLIQAEALRLLHASDVWHPYADWRMVNGKETPSWRSFVLAYLPVRYVTAVAAENAIETYGDKLGWSPERMQAVGLSKMQAARRLVEDEIEAGGLTQETTDVLESGTHEDVLYRVAQVKGQAIGFAFDGMTGDIMAYIDGQPFKVGWLDRQTPEQTTEGQWLGVLELAVKRLKCTITE